MEIHSEDEKQLDRLYQSKDFAYELGYKRGAKNAKELRDTLKAMLAYLSDEDEEGLLEQVEIFAYARYLLAKTREE